MESQHRFLVIDDSAADVKVLRALLMQASFADAELVHCLSADEGLEKLRNERFDCVFLDYILDEANGLDVLRMIRESGNDVPIIACSGYGNELVAVESLKLGAQDYLVKGVLTPEAVQRALRNAMEKVSLTRQIAEQQQELNDFVSVASHDLRAPLRRIVGFTQILQQELAPSIDRKSSELLETVCANAKRMERLIESLLEYTRIGRSQKTLVPVDLSEVFAQATSNLAQAIEAAGARVQVEDLEVVVGDEVALTQLFQNLISNAIKFRSEVQPVVSISGRREGDFYEVSVADNGIGIDQEYHERIFGCFCRLHTQSEYEGSGIGLSTCQRIVEQHGGRIWVESAAGTGTTFYFTLQLAEVGKATPDAVAESELILS